MLVLNIAVVLAVAFLVFSVAVTLICFFKIFYSPKRKPITDGSCPIPPGEEYEPYRKEMEDWVRGARELPHTEHTVISYDGLRLYGSYYEVKAGAPIEILFHGYRGSAERDLSGGVYRCFSIGHNALIVDHRGSGKSEGKIITFGAKETEDCKTWINYTIDHIDKNSKIIITGISMGAATVLTAAGELLPENVIGVLADCGYTSTEAIIKKVVRDMKLPPSIIYPYARLAARLLSGFDPNAASPIKSMQSCKLPIIFFHGDADNFVPCYMSEENYAACKSEKKRLVIIEGAAHGICYPVNKEKYISELRDFFGKEADSQ